MVISRASPTTELRCDAAVECPGRHPQPRRSLAHGESNPDRDLMSYQNMLLRSRCFRSTAPDCVRATSPPLQVTRKPGRPNLPQTRRSARQIISSRVVGQTVVSWSSACCPAAARSTARIDTSIRSIRKAAHGRTEHAALRGVDTRGGHSRSHVSIGHCD